MGELRDEEAPSPFRGILVTINIPLPPRLLLNQKSGQGKSNPFSQLVVHQAMLGGQIKVQREGM